MEHRERAARHPPGGEPALADVREEQHAGPEVAASPALAFLRAALSIPWLASSPPALINENKGLFGVNMGHLWGEEEMVLGELEALLATWLESFEG